MKCDKCDGNGVLKESYKYIIEDDPDIYMMTQMCDKCLGTGFLDWIENVTGKMGMVPKSDNFHIFADIASHPSTTYHGGVFKK
jgi:DnaJ-class molecular chaperone